MCCRYTAPKTLFNFNKYCKLEYCASIISNKKLPKLTCKVLFYPKAHFTQYIFLMDAKINGLLRKIDEAEMQ